MDAMEAARSRMVVTQLERRGIEDPRVLEAMRRVPRERFVPADAQLLAYADQPVPIGEGQTISQPYIVAYMTEALGASVEGRVLDVGTGSGYQAAVLAELAREVHTIELSPSLAASARRSLEAQGYDNLRYHVGDGYAGLPEFAPFDAIVAAAAPSHVPPALVAQLADGGTMLLPVGEGSQQLLRLRRRGAHVDEETLIGVRFVPMLGQALSGDASQH